MHADKARRKESVANTLTSAKNDIEHFFSNGEKEKFCFLLYKKCVSGLTLHTKAQIEKYLFGELIFFFFFKLPISCQLG